MCLDAWQVGSSPCLSNAVLASQPSRTSIQCQLPLSLQHQWRLLMTSAPQKLQLMFRPPFYSRIGSKQHRSDLFSFPVWIMPASSHQTAASGWWPHGQQTESTACITARVAGSSCQNKALSGPANLTGAAFTESWAAAACASPGALAGLAMQRRLNREESLPFSARHSCVEYGL